MNRTTIDFGIDLGTTNSAIAVLKGVATEIIKNNDEADITSSAVSIDKKGILHTGLRAKNRIIDRPDDTIVEFKRHMGTNHEYGLESSGQKKRPEDLSAEILKSLRADVQQRTGEVIEACVVTVPAAFELHQCDATRKAGELAGFRQSPLLQEPVAAALAFGFQADAQKAYWLVYDFGGGTFDAALIKAEEGTIHVVNHGGDNFLGGSDIDWALVEKVIVPRILGEYSLKEFDRAHAGKGGRWRQAFAKLKFAAEHAKIDLSRKERASLDTSYTKDLKDELTGEVVIEEFDCELTRNDLIGVAEPFIIRSAEIARRVLKQKNLGKDAVEKMILVGGPTLAPYFRELLTDSLGIPLDYTVDPLTVVARGAAVFAGTQRLGAATPTVVSAGEFSVDLKYKPVGLDSAPLVGGKVCGVANVNIAGFTVELVNEKTQWRSGKIPLKPDGVFMANLHAEKGERNTFLVELFDSEGRKQKITPDRLTYTIGSVVEEQPLINSMGLALADNAYHKFFEKGRGLPIKETHDFKTIQPVRQGQSSEEIRFPVVEGENEMADRNRLVGVLKITGTHIRRDLPAGSEVEVTLRMDESRILTVTAYVPFLDEEFSAKLYMQHSVPDPEELQREFDAELKRMRELKSKAINTQADTAREAIESAEESALVGELRETLAAVQGDPGAAAKAEKRLHELKLKVDEAANSLEWPSLVKEAKDLLKSLQTVVDQHGSDQQRQKAEDIADEIEDIIRERKSERLRKKIDQITKQYFEIVMTQVSWWSYQFQRMEKEQQQMTDQGRATRLLDQGRECITKNNVIGLQNIVRQLWDLLPREIAEQARRGYQAGVV